MSNTGGPSNPSRRDPGNQETSALQRAVAALEKMKTRLDAVERTANEPIAIVGLACRFPGGGVGPEGFWQVLDNCVDAVSEIPTSRWPPSAILDQPQDTRWAALIDDLSQFDAAFFGISPREAETLDPQQRMLLEMAWEAFEDAGIRPETLAGSRSGVFIGISNSDYQLLVGNARSAHYDAYCGTGNLFSTAGGRISFVYGLQGPAVSIDTACSSSLVAISQACQSLRTGDADLAIAGGVNAILSPRTSALLHAAQALSIDGRCKTFDARANGYVRGEGCALIVLKRLSDALRDGDRIRGVIRGWAINQDGRSTGLTAPNVLSQQSMLRQALTRAKLAPADIDYIELHGTGTSLGDPIEADALRAVLGTPRNDGSKLVLGAVKTNIGHLESAAGVAGIVKILLSLEHERIPPNLHFRRLNPRISLDGTPFVIPTAPVPWPRSSRPRRAGVSSFGMSGTNAHIILEETPSDEPRPPTTERSSYLLPLSAKTPEALSALASSYAQWFGAKPTATLHDIVYTACFRRTQLEHRLAVAARTPDEFAQALASFAQGKAPTGVAHGHAVQDPPRIVFVFSGQGSQWAEMGRTLLNEEPIFRASVERIDALVRQFAKFSVLDELRAPEETSQLDQTEVVQPALFALQVGLNELLQSWGIVPNAVIGHSVGEVAAAYVSGALSLEDAVRLVVWRGRIMQKATGLGKMAWVALPAAEAALTLSGLEDKLAIAAINDRASTVLSGETTALDVIVADLQKRGIATRPLRVNYAFHSPQMAPLARELVERMGRSSAKSGTITMYSSLTGKLIDGNALVAEYWGLNLLSTVNFADAVIDALDDKHNIFVEVGPHPVLLANIEQCAIAADRSAHTISTLRRKSHEMRSVLETLGALYAVGVELDWKKLLPEQGRVVSLPTYPWQRKRYWIENVEQAPLLGEPTGHPLLGNAVTIADVDAVFESTLDPKSVPWLQDHRVFGEVIAPGAALLEMARAAGATHLGINHCQVLGFTIQAPLRMGENDRRRVQILLKKTNGDLEVRIFSRSHAAPAEQAWVLHAQGSVRSAEESTAPQNDLVSVQERDHTKLDTSEVYNTFSRLGLDYGPEFQAIRELRRIGEDAFSNVVLSEAMAADASKYGVHPALLDAGLQSLVAAGESREGTTYLPFEFGEVTFFGPAPTRAWVYARLEPAPPGAASVTGSIVWMDETGRVFASLSNLRAKRADAQTMRRAWQGETSEVPLYRLDWQASVLPDGLSWTSGHWLLLSDSLSVAEQLEAQLRSAGASGQAASFDAAPERIADLAASGTNVAGIVCVWNESTNDSPPALAEQTTASALRVVQFIVRAGFSTRLFFVTHRGIAAGGHEAVSVAQAPVWGFGRAVRSEHPELVCKLIDIDGAPNNSWWRELAASDDESEVVWRSGKRFVARMVKANPPRIPEGECVALAIRDKGELSNLYLESVARRALGVNEIEIEVYASGLNFRDVLNALGMYPGEAGLLGAECAGVVVAVGQGVTEFVVGDCVMGLAAGAFRSFATVDARLMSRIPCGISLAQAATIPIVFLTAYYALHDLGNLKAGERILVHAAAGGVGMAAVQMARCIGAEVLATASPSKWSVVRNMGVEHIANSRTLEFAPAFRDITNGRGVDVVLNSLAGDFIDASFSILSPGGRFLEMGKTDIRTSESIAAAFPERVYRAFDLMDAGPDRIREMFQAVVERFESGDLSPLPLRGFGLLEAEEAFRTMAQAQHIGKIVLRALPKRPLKANATVLVTGGLGALGVHVAQWLWEQHHVAHIVLVSRKPPTPEKIVQLERLRAEGASITVAAVDVSNAAAVRELVQSVSTVYPLRGVIHAAGVLDDGLISEQTADRFSRVFAPKVQGAWNLHEATRTLPLDFFVLFSSIASVLGSAGQSNYAAANAFLNALAHARHAEGLPSQSLQWGAWAEGGMAAELSEALQSRLLRTGVGMLSAAQGLSLLESAIARPEAEFAAMVLDVQTLERSLGLEIPPIWRILLTVKPRPSAARISKGVWRDHLAHLSEQAREAEVRAGIREDIAKVLSFGSANDVPDKRPLQELGLDSLMAVELRNAISARVGTRLPATLLFDYPTVDALRQYLLEKVLVFTTAPAAPVPQKPLVSQSDDAIAIIGMGCRFPGGVHDPDSFWQLLENEVDAIREVPNDRWDIDAFYDPNPDAPGKMNTRFGGFLDELDRFEPGFFGISPREAQSLDPQQRLLLETTWEALERAGIPAERLMGSDTGVYVGICGTDYQHRLMHNVEDVNAYSLLGTAHSAVVGRISYWLGLQGPNMAVDTACSSSLVSVHLACRAIRAGECSMAIVGGVNVILSPGGTVYFSRLKAMSPTGRCHTFAADADGYVRSEGCAIVVLKRLADAKRDGDSILALIRGTAINQDGRSQGLTAPNGPAQERVIRTALSVAGVRPAEIDYVEAHGTGTPLGDPIEVQALANVLGEGRDADKPVVIGSVKTNFGHTEGAAGVAGLVKATLSLAHESVPRNLHFTEPNPHIAWSDFPVRVANERLSWRRNSKRRLAGVSSFGFSGTNAHIVLEEAPALEPSPTITSQSAYLLPLSAKTPEALAAYAAAFAQWFAAKPDSALDDIVYTASARRTHHEYRLAAVARTHEEFATALGAFARGESPADVVPGIVSHQAASNIAFVFSGQGSQWPGMGKTLLVEEPAFRAKLEQIDALVRQHANFSVLEELSKPEETSRLAETEIVQPALFAIQVGLAELFKSWGIIPTAVMGHSVGEVAAAHVCGAISLEDAVQLVVLRGRIMQKATGYGKMVWVALPAAQAEVEIAEFTSQVAIAAINDPTSVVLSGEPKSLDTLVDRLDKRGTATRPLRVNYAFHSPQMTPLASELVASLGQLARHETSIALYSTVTGKSIDSHALAPEYWGRNVRETVQLAEAVSTALDDGHQLLIEIGPHPVLLANLEQCAATKNCTLHVVPTLRRQNDERRALLKTLGALYVVGVGIDAKKPGPTQGRVVPLPTYPWQRERYWIETGSSAVPDGIADWFYRVHWSERPSKAPRSFDRSHGAWLLLADRGGVGQRLAAELSLRDQTCTLLTQDDSETLLAEHLSSSHDWRGIVYLWGLDAIVHDDMPASEVNGLAVRILDPLRGVLSAFATRSASRLWIITQSACVLTQDAVVNPCQTALWGFGRVAGLEHPATWGGLIDVESQLTTSDVESLVAELLSPDDEDELALRRGRWYAPRLLKHGIDKPSKPLTISPDITCLITGGLSGIGLSIAQWLVDHGARHLVLTSRRGMEAPGAREFVAKLESNQVHVAVSAIDITDVGAMNTLIMSANPPIRAVFHCAGANLVQPIQETEPAMLSATLQPKVAGAWALHQMFEGHTLDWFVLFSSGASVWGGSGQSAYAAANAFLDGLAQVRRLRELPITCINWGTWAEGGMSDAQALERLKKLGVLPMPTPLALKALERSLGTGQQQITITRMDWSRFVPIYATQKRRNLLTLLVRPEDQPEVPKVVSPTQTWKGLSANEVRAWVRDFVRQTVESVLGFSNSRQIDLNRGFAEQGLDSLMAVDIRNRIQKELGVPLSATIAFDHPTVERLATHLVANVLKLDVREAMQPTQTISANEPIAIIGVACRFPGGATDPDAFWQLLLDSGIAANDVPPDRWNVADFYDPNPDTPGRTYCKKGGFLAEIDRFDPTFFRISPREALSLDPQQRLLLELSWEALERAGEDPALLREGATGVFVGIGPNDYAQRVLHSSSASVRQYAATGAAPSFTAGRISFVLGLHGPSLAVDTACSSSLVALHLACESLRRGECDRALAGGVNLLLSPQSFIALSSMRAISVDGRCKTFSAEADGYGRAEGCAVVVLKRLSDAIRNTDRILAIVRGTAINHDGPSSGLTVPNGPAQQALIRQALASANLSTLDVDFVECHGTGTKLGDPIEVGALSETYGHGRPKDQPLILGAVKANLGHLEAAAGLAGIIKAVWALNHAQIPPQPRLGELNPHIAWRDIAVTVPREVVPWPSSGRPRRAAVSAFGLSGTNAHVILEEAPRQERTSFRDAPSYLLPLSAKTPDALKQLATSYQEWFLRHDEHLYDVAYTASLRRNHGEYRLGVVGSTKEEIASALGAFAAGEMPPSVVTGKTTASAPKVVFVFSGQGSQWAGMSRQLYREEKAFRDALDRCDEAIRAHMGLSIIDELHKSEDTSRLQETIIAQPALFALEVALAALLQSWNIAPSAVVGHSVGEIAAAHVAGALDLAQAARLVCIRARVMQKATGQGKMVSVSLSEEAALEAIAGFEDHIGIAAINDRQSVVLSGNSNSMDALLGKLASNGIQSRPLRVNYAFHSPQMEPLTAEFADALGVLQTSPATIPMLSTVTGKPLGDVVLDTGYWARNIRQTVRFADAITSASSNEPLVFVEVGPHPVLALSMEQTLAASNLHGHVTPTMRRGKDERKQTLGALAALHVHGYAIDWTRLYLERGSVIALPTYPWQRQRYWLDAPPVHGSDANLVTEQAGTWPLAGMLVRGPGSTMHHVLRIGPSHQSFLADHIVFGRIIVPGAFHIAVILAIATRRWPDQAIELNSIEFLRAIALDPSEERELHAVLTQDSDEFVFELATQNAPNEDWIVHARGRVSPSVAQPGRVALPPDIESQVHQDIEQSELISMLSAICIDWGPAWRWLHQGRTGNGFGVANLMPPMGDMQSAAPLHPCLIDNSFAAAFLSRIKTLNATTPHLPFSVECLRWWRVPGDIVRCRAMTRTSETNTDTLTSDLVLINNDGTIVAEIEGLTSRLAPRDKFLQSPSKAPTESVYRIDWQDAPLPVETTETPIGQWLVVADATSQRASALVSLLPSSLWTNILDLPAVLDRHAHLAGILCLWDSSHNELIPDAALHISTQAISLLQTLQSHPHTPNRLVWVTSNAIGFDVDGPIAPALGSIWGLGRAVFQEQPERGLRLIDAPTDAQNDVLLREITARDDENQVLYRHGRRLVARLVKAGPIRELPIPEGESYTLAIHEKGELSNLFLQSVERRAPVAGHVEIEIYASGLNFRDVLNALGMYPGEAGPLGGECAGTIVAIGEGVTDLAIGDSVMALSPRSFSAFTTVDARCVARIPDGISFAQAATIPAAFLTAYYALYDLGQLKAGERILIHAAAGGVGMAAVQLARRLGAEVYATASPTKWPAVRNLGVEHLANSRTLEFASTFHEATQGRGVDVVLNSLTGEFIDASLSILSPHGRFVEMGKLDIRTEESITFVHPQRRYSTFDLVALKADRIREMFQALVEGFHAGELTPLPLRCFGLAQAEDAFRSMAQAQHIGKIVLRALPKRTMTPSSTVLVTGGLGALGMHVARWLWEKHRVSHIVLTSRHAPTPEKVVELERLRSDGAMVTVQQVDVAHEAVVKELVQSISRERPLRGIIHAAGVIDDGLIADQTEERFAKVFAPKVQGAWNLHQATRTIALDFFIMFSSVASILGGSGQSNYAAANAFMDALAHARQAQGLPAQSLHWGPWAESGMAANLSDALQSRMSRMGMGMHSPAQGISFLEAALTRPDAELVTMALDLEGLRQRVDQEIPTIWRSLVAPKVAASAARLAKGMWRDVLARLTEQQREVEVGAGIREDIAKVLSFASVNDIPEDRPLQELGLDSLMAVELRNAISARVGTRLPATLLFDYPTVNALRRHLLETALLFDAQTPAPVQPHVNPTLAHADDAIAIVGAGCRFPGGVRDLDGLWQLLEDEIDTIREVPKDRWNIDAFYDPNPNAPGKMTSRWGGFLQELDLFEPGFFGISPREALSLDPQQRLLLETTWEALESAGIQAERLMGTDTGVFVGICGNEYQQRLMENIDTLDAYSVLGTAHSTIVGRISYWLGLQGPNLAVDTACSSSLVAVHLACRAILSGECSVALAGGVNVVLSPVGTVYFSRLKVLSPTGRCHSFSADADGYVRSEGCAMVVLKRLSDALRNNDPILAVIRGTAINQGGRSQGLTAPNGPAQEAVIQTALKAGGVRPADIKYVEAHGTGTPLGDPIEVQALAHVLGEGRHADDPVLIGSVKTNIGHTEGAAGIAGLLKAALALSHETIPRSLHFTKPNPHIAWSELGVRVAHEQQPWRRKETSRFAGVHSFGFNGTNAHIVLEEAPRIKHRTLGAKASAYLLPLSAKTPAALIALAASYTTWLTTQGNTPLQDIVSTASLRRTHHDYRLAAVGRTHEELAGALRAFADGIDPADIVQGRASSNAESGIVFVFSGQGSQWAGMGKTLLAEQPVFHAKVEEIDALVRRHAPFSLLDELRAPEAASRLGETEIVQPALFALQIGLVELFKFWGIVPHALVGYGVGEVAAAHVSGAVSLEDAVRIVVLRGRIMQKATGPGRMVWAALPAVEAEHLLAGQTDKLSVAAINDPSSVVLSGETNALDRLIAVLDQRGIPTRPLRGNHAFQSPLMEPLARELVATLGRIDTQTSVIPMYSTVTATRIEGGDLDAAYWGRNIRATVNLAAAVRTALDKHLTLVEIGPHPILLGHLKQCVAAQQAAARVVPTLRRQGDELRDLMKTLGTLYAAGIESDWKKVWGEHNPVVSLPAYPWQRERYWVDPPPKRNVVVEEAGDHPFLGKQLSPASQPELHI